MNKKMAKEFIKYLLDFYGNGGIYDMAMTEDEIIRGMELRVEIYPDIKFVGDSMDREMIRDIVQDFRKGVYK